MKNKILIAPVLLVSLLMSFSVFSNDASAENSVQPKARDTYSLQGTDVLLLDEKTIQSIEETIAKTDLTEDQKVLEITAALTADGICGEAADFYGKDTPNRIQKMRSTCEKTLQGRELAQDILTEAWKDDATVKLTLRQAISIFLAFAMTWS